MSVKEPVLGPKAIPLDVEPVSAAPDGVLDSGIGGNSPVSPSLLTGSDPEYAAIAGQALRHSGNAGGLLGGGNPQPATPRQFRNRAAGGARSRPARRGRERMAPVESMGGTGHRRRFGR